jgi:GT2 family glycosyltransferase
MVNIITINWNAGLQLSEVVASVAQYHNGLVSSVIIVDNASTDDSLAQVEGLQNLPFQLQIIRNTNNRGFGAACNQGALLAASDFLLFLNPDTRLYENSLSVPVAFMQDTVNQDVGVVGIQLIDEQNCIARSCARFPTLGIFIAQSLGLNRLPGLRQLNTHMSDWAHDETRAVDHVIGAFYLLHRSTFESLGGFDERFFVYLEDLDLSLRAKQAGWRSVYLTEAKAFHAGGGTSSQVKAARLFYSLRSRLLYGFKHLGSWQAWFLMLITLGVEPVIRTIFSFAGSGFSGASNTWRAYGMLFRDMRSILEISRK